MIYALLVIAYITVGLFAARQVRFMLENSIDDHNEVVDAKVANFKKLHGKGKCSGNTSIHRDGTATCYYCSANERVGRRKTLYDTHGAGASGYPLVTGLAWPVVGLGYVLYRVVRVIVNGVGPLVVWFFENPKHRKARNSLAQ